MQRDRIPVVSVRPRESAVFYEHAGEVGRVFQKLDHSSGFLQDRPKIPRAEGSVGKFQFKLKAAEPTDADHVNHHHLGEHGLAFEHRSPITATPWTSINIPGTAKFDTVIRALPG